MAELLVTLSRGLGGISGEYPADERGNRGSLSGMSGELEANAGRCADGAYVVDLFPIAESAGFVRAVWNCPLVDVRLAEADVDHVRPRLAEADGSVSLIAATIAGNFFGAAGVAGLVHDGPEPGPFDYVSPARWWAYWRDHGARVGRVHAGAIQWEAGR